MEKEMKLSYGIKGKLISATAMLLVAVIMVVSSTYAWFTLSTAPEVTSISTAVGANGALEIVLNTFGSDPTLIPTGSLNGVTGAAENSYWGNLINLGYNDEYGTNVIVLQPSKLNLVGDKINDEAPVTIPDYNANGRVEGTVSAGQFGMFNGTNFVEANDETGFRAIGKASGLSERQQAFRTAIAAIATAQGNALRSARTSLDENGDTLAAIAVNKALNGDSATFALADVNAINAMIADLTDSVKYVESAYIQALVATALSRSNAIDDEAALLAAATIRAHDVDGTVGTRLENALAAASVDLDGVAGYDIYLQALTALNNTTPIAIGQDQTEFTWAEIRPALTNLVNMDEIMINNVAANQVNTEAGKNEIASDVMGSKGITVKIPSGGGIYADIADLCENYTVEIVLNAGELTGGVVGDLEVNAKMQALSTGNYKYLTNVRTTLNNLSPEGDTTGTMPFTEFYGYVIDLGFKTNASQSNLLLQYEATDRIYEDNDNEDTMGGGSTMSFKTTAAGFTTDKVQSLMGKIRVVFFNTEDYTILAEAKLDMDNATATADGVTAALKIIESVDNMFEYAAGGTTVTLYSKTVDDGMGSTSTEYYTDKALTVAYGEAVDESKLTPITTRLADQDDAVITSLGQNTEHWVSALVYLDGETMTNEDVAATEERSLEGTVNIQFASSANLVPMEYGELYKPAN